MAERPQRANFTLDEELTQLARILLDQFEQRNGFRPSMAQLIGGLIRKAAEQPPEPEQ